MLKTIFKKFFSTSTLIISFQLCFSPLVFAQAQDGMSNSETKWNKVATGFSIGATVFNSAVAQVTQAGIMKTFLVARTQSALES